MWDVVPFFPLKVLHLRENAMGVIDVNNLCVTCCHHFTARNDFYKTSAKFGFYLLCLIRWHALRVLKLIFCLKVIFLMFWLFSLTQRKMLFYCFNIYSVTKPLTYQEVGLSSSKIYFYMHTHIYCNICIILFQVTYIISCSSAKTLVKCGKIKFGRW